MIGSRRGAAGSQYALVIGLVAVVALLSVMSVGGNLRTLLTNVSNRLGNAEGGNTGAAAGGESVAAPKTTPDVFAMPQTTNQDLGTVATSATIALANFTGAVTVTCPGCSQMARNGVWSATTSVAGYVQGDTMALRATASGLMSASTPISFTVGANPTQAWTISTPAVYALVNSAYVIVSNNTRTFAAQNSVSSYPSWQYASAYSNTRNAGKFYAEVKVDTLTSAANQHWATGFYIYNAGGGFVGQMNFAAGDASNQYYLWKEDNTDAGNNIGTSNLSYKFVAGDTVKLAIDCAAGKAWVGVNGSWYGGGNPATGANPTFTYANPSAKYITPNIIYQVTANTNNARRATFNFGDTAFAYTPPTGFTPWR